MGKLAAAGSAVIAGGGIATGGVVLSKIFSIDSTLPRTFDEFQKQETPEGCVSSLFPTLEKFSGGEEISSSDTSKKVESTFFGDNDKHKTEGCLVVNGDKEKYKGTKVDGSDDKGTGAFRLLGSLKKSDNKGFVVFASAETDKEKKLWGKGAAYALEKEKDKGSISRKRTVETGDNKNKKFDKSNVEDKFPKFKGDNNQLPFGGFIGGKDDLDNICGDSDCKPENKKSKSFNGYWVWKGEENGGEEVKNGADNNTLSTGGEGVFGKGEWDMDALISGMKGKGEKKVWHGIDKPQITSKVA